MSDRLVEAANRAVDVATKNALLHVAIAHEECAQALEMVEAGPKTRKVSLGETTTCCEAVVEGEAVELCDEHSGCVRPAIRYWRGHALERSDRLLQPVDLTKLLAT